MNMNERKYMLLLCVVGACTLLLPSCKKGEKKKKQTRSSAASRPAPSKKDPTSKAPVFKPAKRRVQIFAKPAFAQGVPKSKKGSLSDVAELAIKSVVNVRSTKRVRGRHPMYGHPYFRRHRAPRAPRARSLGSGVIVSRDGVIITNHHVVKQATAIKVTLNDDREYDAQLVGSDAKSDLAVLRIINPPKVLTPIPFGDSHKARLGEVVLAIGNPFGVGQTVTMGIVSALGRAKVGIVDYEDFIQTDAAINPGNSGGALVNMRGELIGINTAILSRSGGYQGIGFAIPTAMVRPIMESILKNGRMVRGWLGVAIQGLGPRLAKALKLSVDRGVLIVDVQPGSPAAKAGVQSNDVVVAIDGRPVNSAAKLRNVVGTAGPNKTIKLDVQRNAKKVALMVVLGELPSAKTASIPPSQGALGGLQLSTVDDSLRRRFGYPRGLSGVAVVAVKPHSAAFAAGLLPGDVVTALNRQPITNTAQFSMGYRSARGTLLIKIYRDGAFLYLTLEK
jgi:serine protease Do